MISHLFFGLGVRNVTKIFVPKDYDFIPLIASFNKYLQFGDHHKYKNNYDYQLAIQLLNKQYYMTNGSTLLIENESPFSPISQLNIEYYETLDGLLKNSTRTSELQCIVGKKLYPVWFCSKPNADGLCGWGGYHAFLLNIVH
jgi:hypothetical protein